MSRADDTAADTASLPAAAPAETDAQQQDTARPGMATDAVPRRPAVAAGDRVLLLERETGRRWLVLLDGAGARKEKGLGVLDPARFDGVAWGAAADVAGKHVVVLSPTVADLHATLRRKAQVILAKDASRIAYELGISPGDRVFECGIGSGAATLVLAAAVGAQGRVVVQELRDDFAAWATDNVARAGFGDRVQVHLGDLTVGLADGVHGPFDACLLDVPEPWACLDAVVPALAPGARVAAYCPQVGQMETTVRALRDRPFADVRALELIERAWEVKERGSRPAFEGLGHTGFLVFARFVPA